MDAKKAELRKRKERRQGNDKFRRRFKGKK